MCTSFPPVSLGASYLTPSVPRLRPFSCRASGKGKLTSHASLSRRIRLTGTASSAQNLSRRYTREEASSQHARTLRAARAQGMSSCSHPFTRHEARLPNKRLFEANMLAHVYARDNGRLVVLETRSLRGYASLSLSGYT